MVVLVLSFILLGMSHFTQVCAFGASICILPHIPRERSLKIALIAQTISIVSLALIPDLMGLMKDIMIYYVPFYLAIGQAVLCLLVFMNILGVTSRLSRRLAVWMFAMAGCVYVSALYDVWWFTILTLINVVQYTHMTWSYSSAMEIDIHNALVKRLE